MKNSFKIFYKKFFSQEKAEIKGTYKDIQEKTKAISVYKRTLYFFNVYLVFRGVEAQREGERKSEAGSEL